MFNHYFLIKLSVRATMLSAVRNQPYQMEEDEEENDETEDLPDVSNGFVDYTLDANIFKKKKEKSSKDKKSNETNNEFNFKTYTDNLRLEIVEKYGKPEDWDVLNEEETSECFEEVAVEKEMISLQDFIEINYKKATQVILRCKTNPSILVHPSLIITEKIQDKDTLTWSSFFQNWKINQSGVIYNQFFPKVCLTMNTSVGIKLAIYFKDQKRQKHNGSKKLEELDEPTPPPIYKTAYLVTFTCRKLGQSESHQDHEQKWHFNKFGHIESKALNRSQQLVLTSLDLLNMELNNLSQNKNILENYELKMSDEDSIYQLGEINLIMLESFDSQIGQHQSKTFVKVMKDLAKSQHWAIKQEGFQAKSNREYKLTKLGTLKWQKLCYSWPVDEKEELIKEFTWPLSGCLVAGAPILKSLEEKTDDNNEQVKLRVLKNGNIDFSSAVIMSRSDVKKSLKEQNDPKNMQLEFNAFLQSCMSALNFSKAVRRLFDEKGEEHFDLTKLKNDQIVFVSTGESWIDPKTVKEESERKRLLTNLATDIQKMAYFNRLKVCNNYVIETCKTSLQEGTRLVLGTCCLTDKQIERIKQGESIQYVIDVEDKPEDNDDDKQGLYVHFNQIL